LVEEFEIQASLRRGRFACFAFLAFS